MKRILTIGLVAASVALSGCSVFRTELKSKEVRETTRPGLTYRLPARQFTLTTTYEVNACRVDNNGVVLGADVKATLSERLVGAEAYTISYRQLDTLTKITNTEFRLSEAGLLTSINAGINDQTGAVIQNTAIAATGIARAVAMPTTSVMAAALKNMQNKEYGVALSQLQLLQMKIGKPGEGITPAQTADDFEALQKYAKAMSAVAPAPSCTEVDDLIKIREQKEAALKTEQATGKKRDAAKRKKAEAEAEIARLAALAEVYAALGKDKEKPAS